MAHSSEKVALIVGANVPMGILDTDSRKFYKIWENIPDFVERNSREGIVAPDDLAANYVMLYNQPRNAWTFELDIRPRAEPR